MALVQHAYRVLGHEQEFDTLASLIEHFHHHPIDAVPLAAWLECKHDYRLGALDEELQHGRDTTLNGAVIAEARKPRYDVVGQSVRSLASLVASIDAVLGLSLNVKLKRSSASSSLSYGKPAKAVP
jgi:hypothetical protein